MAKRIVLEVTEHEFTAMVDIANTISAMKGCGGEFADEADRNLKAFDRMMKRNGYKRSHN
jgi:hypothetical protein